MVDTLDERVKPRNPGNMTLRDVSLVSGRVGLNDFTPVEETVEQTVSSGG